MRCAGIKAGIKLKGGQTFVFLLQLSKLVGQITDIDPAC